MPLRVLNMVMNIYSGPRLVRAHGAVALPVKGNHGLIAGCAFAKDVLKAFLKEAAEVARPLHFRDYVDDMTLMTVGSTGDLAARSLHRGLGRVKHVLRRDNMILNDTKEQVFAQYQVTRRCWEDTGGCPTVDAARDLGVFHVGAGHGHPVLTEGILAQRKVAVRIGMIPGTQKFRARMAAAIFFGKFLYGCEAHVIPKGDFGTSEGSLPKPLAGGGGCPKGPRAAAQ